MTFRFNEEHLDFLEKTHFILMDEINKSDFGKFLFQSLLTYLELSKFP